MSQPKLKALVKLLKEYEFQFQFKAGRPWDSPDESQPMYGEVLRLIVAQVSRGIE